MKKILVPVDFSNASKNALTYAIKFSEDLNASINMFHVYRHFVDASAPVLTVPMNDWVGKSAEQFMTTFLSEVRDELDTDHPDVHIDIEAVMGLATDEVAEKTKCGECDLVMMGKTGKTSLADKLFGSVTTTTIERTYCPVIAIPENAKYKGINRILFATDLFSIDNKILKQVLDFALKFKARVYFVHVTDTPGTDMHVEEELFERIFEIYAVPPVPFEIRMVTGPSVEKALNKFVETNDIDLMMMVTQHRSPWERLFLKSYTREMAMHMTVPLLVLHTGDDVDFSIKKNLKQSKTTAYEKNTGAH
ncbi:MAG: universal stress protein [Bacteroidota bacterium]